MPTKKLATINADYSREHAEAILDACLVKSEYTPMAYQRGLSHVRYVFSKKLKGKNRTTVSKYLKDEFKNAGVTTRSRYSEFYIPEKEGIETIEVGAMPKHPTVIIASFTHKTEHNAPAVIRKINDRFLKNKYHSLQQAKLLATKRLPLPPPKPKRSNPHHDGVFLVKKPGQS